MRDRATERERLYLTAKYYSVAFGDLEKAISIYQRISRLPLSWTNADPDIPILKQAKAEYAKLK
jgi:hypothetical protein